MIRIDGNGSPDVFCVCVHGNTGSLHGIVTGSFVSFVSACAYYYYYACTRRNKRSNVNFQYTHWECVLYICLA